MKAENKNEISKKIDAKRMADLMEAGRGKQKDRLQIKATYKDSDVTSGPQKVWDKMKDGTKWKNTELSTVTGIDRQTIGKLRNGKYYDNLEGGSTPDLIEKISEALDVDPEYLTGEQRAKRKKKLTPAEEQKRKDRSAELEKGRQLRILADLLKIYSIHLQFDHPVTPKQYSLYDADGQLIREDLPVEDLDGLVSMIMNYLRTGSDLISLFFGDIWIDEI